MYSKSLHSKITQIEERHSKRVQLTTKSIFGRFQLLLVIVSYIFLKFVYIMVSFILFAKICVVIHDFRSFSGVNLPVLASCGVHPSSFGFTNNSFFLSSLIFKIILTLTCSFGFRSPQLLTNSFSFVTCSSTNSSIFYFIL